MSYYNPKDINRTLRVRVSPERNHLPYSSQQAHPRRRGASFSIPCGFLILVTLCFFIFVSFIFIFPVKTTILFLGIDYAPRKSFVGRSDTIVLITFNTIKPYVGVLSIPRDLWVQIPGVGENRINTAHFFAEAQQAGTGPQATIMTIQQNFGVTPNYYIRIRFDGVREIVDAMGGVDITLAEPIGGYSPGIHHLSGEKALGFARRRQGADDFFRMKQGQILIKAILKQSLKPINWFKLPRILQTIITVTDTNIPLWRLPQVSFAVLRTGIDHFDSRIIDREMVTPITTDQGANVLLPNWDLIHPLINDMFGMKP